eukprot:IDg1153t1
MPFTKPLVTAEKFQQIKREKFPSPGALMQIMRAARAMSGIQYNVTGHDCVDTAKSNIPGSGKKVSLDFLLRLSIQGTASERPAKISNLVLLDKPSNSVDTAATLMDTAEHLTARQSRSADDDPNSYGRILPQAGHMHQSMAFQDALKFCCWDACLDALAAESGLSAGMVENFRARKEYKTCLRLIRQCLVSMWIRVLDVVFDEGLILATDSDLRALLITPCATGGDARSLADVLQMLSDAAKTGRPVYGNFNTALKCNPEFFSRTLETIGTRIMAVVNDRAAAIDEPQLHILHNGCHAFLSCSLLVNVLCQSGRPAPAVWQLEFEATASKSILEAMYGPGGTCTNITGQSRFGSVEDDETLEMTGVRETKLSASAGMKESLRTSFFSSQRQVKLRIKLQQECRSVPFCEEGDETYGAEGENRGQKILTVDNLLASSPSWRRNECFREESSDYRQHRTWCVAWLSRTRSPEKAKRQREKTQYKDLLGASDLQRKQTAKEAKRKSGNRRVQLVKTSTQHISRQLLECSDILGSIDNRQSSDRSVPFLMQGYPPIPNTTDALSGHRQLARVAADSLLRVAAVHGLQSLEFHIDDPRLVPLKKSGVQAYRDSCRVSRSPQAESDESFQFSLSGKVPDDWGSK